MARSPYILTSVSPLELARHVVRRRCPDVILEFHLAYCNAYADPRLL